MAQTMTPPMAGEEQWAGVDRYLVDLIVRPDAAVASAQRISASAGLPAIEVSPNQGKLLMLLALATGARRMLEIGTLGGYSTIWLARALRPDGCLTTIEVDPKHAAVARANIAAAGLSEVVDVTEGRADEVLAQMASACAGGCEDPFDIIFIDADKPGYVTYFEYALKLSRPGTVIFADNVVRKGEVANPQTEDERVQGIQRFLERVAAEPHVTATALQTVGSKGHDGFLLAVVNS